MLLVATVPYLKNGWAMTTWVFPDFFSTQTVGNEADSHLQHSPQIPHKIAANTSPQNFVLSFIF